MTKKSLIAVLLGLTVFSNSYASLNAGTTDVKVQQHLVNPVEDKEYSLLAQPIENAPTIIEFFSFTCHSCYNYQYVYQIPQKLHKLLKDKQTYRYVNIDSLLNAGTITQAWALSEKLGKEDDMLNELYYGLQTKQNIKGAEDIKHLFMTQPGITEEEFFKLWDNQDVIANKEMQTALSKQAEIRKTPTFVINGKYKINVDGIDAKTHEEFIDKFIAIVEYLKTK